AVRQVADAAFDLGHLALAIEAVDQSATGGRDEDAHEHADGRRLPGTVRTQEAKDLAFPDLQGNRCDRLECTVTLAQPLDRDHGASPTNPAAKRAVAKRPSSRSPPLYWASNRVNPLVTRARSSRPSALVSLAASGSFTA